MNPVLSATLRRHWPVFGALGVVLVLTILSQAWYRPMAERYRRTVRQADELGMALNPSQSTSLLPPRLFALITHNSLPAAEAEALSSTGTLAAQMLGDLTAMMSARGIQILGTEPGTVSQQPRFVQARAHARARGRYHQVVGLLEDLAASGKLFAVESMTLTPDASGGLSIDLWVSRLVLKQERRP